MTNQPLLLEYLGALDGYPESMRLKSIAMELDCAARLGEAVEPHDAAVLARELYRVNLAVTRMEAMFDAVVGHAIQLERAAHQGLIPRYDANRAAGHG